MFPKSSRTAAVYEMSSDAYKNKRKTREKHVNKNKRKLVS